MAPAADDAGPSGASTGAAAAPLNAAADVGATLTKDVHQVEWNGQVSANSFHLFVNKTAEPLELSWGDDHYDNPHSRVEPHKNTFVGTYNFHKWRVRSSSRGLIASYTGPSIILTVTNDGYTTELNPTGQRPAMTTTTGTAGAAAAAAASAAAGAGAATGAGAGTSGGGGGSVAGGQASEAGYRQRSSVLGMPIWAFDCVSDAAVSRLSHVVGAMLAHSPPPLLERMVAGGASFAVFGLDQVVSDVPAHRFMRYNTGRDLDQSARGLGATPTVPVTSCGEENLTMQGDRWYPCQSILIHEVGHMVHNMGLQPEGVEGVLEAYRAAVKSRLYPRGCYMMTNEQEYWAVAVESWFESTVREDVNGGVKTRAALRRHDPRLAALLAAAFGDGDWRYWKDCPRPLAMPTRGSAVAAAAAAAPQRQQPSASAAAAASSGVAPTQPPLWRSRRPPKLSVDSLMAGAESSAAAADHDRHGQQQQQQEPGEEEDIVVLIRWGAAATANCLRSLGLGGGGGGAPSWSSRLCGGGCSCWLPVPPPPPAPLPTSTSGSASGGAAGAGGAMTLAGLSQWVWGPCGGGRVSSRGKRLL